MTARKTIALAAVLLLAPFALAKNCDPHAFGAKGDGTTPDTAALQKAIDTCAAQNGPVHLTAGTYLSAPLTLRSHTHLILDTGAIILGSLNVDDYPVRTEPSANWRRTALIHADNATDISIVGPGVIDGSGQQWWDMAEKARTPGDTSGNGANGFTRPLLLDFVNCTHLLFDGITVRNSPMYNFTFFGSSYITLTNIKIRNPQFSHNTDGIDPFYSSHIKIDHASIDTGDDNIAIKSGLVERGEPNLPTFDITITNSEMLHGHGLSIGSELAGGVHDVTVDNVTFKGGDAGIRVKSRRTRGNDIYNLKYTNLRMEDVKLPIEISAYYPEKTIPLTEAAQPMAEHTPRFHDITIANVTATGALTALMIAGLPESPIKNLTITNVSISGAKGGTIQLAWITEKNFVIKTDVPVEKRDGVHITEVK